MTQPPLFPPLSPPTINLLTALEQRDLQKQQQEAGKLNTMIQEMREYAAKTSALQFSQGEIEEEIEKVRGMIGREREMKEMYRKCGIRREEEQKEM